MDRDMSHAYVPPYRRDYGGACHIPALPAIAMGISAAAAVAGAGMAYMGAQTNAQAASNAANYNAEVNANNQKIADAAAATATQEGAVQQQQKAYQEETLVGEQKAGLAANGVDVGSGTSLDLLSDTKAAGEFDQLTIVNNAQRESAGYINQGISYQNQAVVDQQESAAQLQGGALKADSALVTGAGSVASDWYKYSAATGTGSSSSDAGNFAGNGSIY
jgi:hypothetical protein